MNVFYAVLTLSIMGLLFGGLLAYASKVFAVEQDERIPMITEALPGANCGGCGFAGCGAYAAAVVNEGAKTNLCPVGGDSTAAKMAEIMGVEASKTERFVARVLCCGTTQNAQRRYDYIGIDDCLSVMRLGGGAKSCTYGCTGLGTCVKQCKFGAISIVNGVAFVDKDKCAACTMCIKSCPKHIISLVPYDTDEWVGCSSKDKGADARKYCAVSCIGCRICEKNCPEKAITVTDNLAKIDYDKCSQCGICVEKCPRKCILTNKPAARNEETGEKAGA